MHYQKCSKFSPDGKFYTAGSSTGQFTIWKWPELANTAKLEFSKEIIDISIQDQTAIVTTSTSVSSIDLAKGKIRSVLEYPKSINTPAEFRSALYNFLIVLGQARLRIQFLFVSMPKTKRMHIYSNIPKIGHW